MESLSTNEKEKTNSNKQTVYVKCQSCGSNMVFDPKTQSLKCKHCGDKSSFDKSDDVKELSIEDAFNVVENWDTDSTVYRCNNCGAVVVLDAMDSATFCPYCSTSHIVKEEDLSGLKPNAVYPFTLTNDEALSNSKTWVKKKIFAPKKFKKSLVAPNIRGIYEPCFTFDSQTYSTYQGRIGKRHTRTVGSGKNRRTQTYIVWRHISGTFDYSFDDVMIDSSTSFDQKVLDNLSPFNYDTIKVYEKNYLSGYFARRHDKSISDAWVDAKDVIDKVLKRKILSQYVYDVVDYLNVSTIHNEVTYKYVLLPTYQLVYKYNKKNYNVYINGNTGKVAGKVPLSPLKIGLACLIGVAIIGLIGLLLF